MIYDTARSTIRKREEQLQTLTRSIRRRLEPEAGRGRSRHLEELLSYIHHRLFDPDLSIGQACRKCGIRDHNISTRFRQAVGRSMREYIEDHRIRTAQELLARTDSEVYLIAFAVGYRYQESFNRAFRRRTGCSPLRWRARVAAGSPRLPAGARRPDAT